MKHSKRFLGLLIALAMCAGFVPGAAVTALAADADSGYRFDEDTQTLTITGGSENIYKLSGESDIGRVIITSSEDITLLLAGVSIENDSAPPIEITGECNVTIMLSGENTITSTYENYAGVQLSNGNLIITSADGDGETTGSLSVTGGKNGAGIGVCRYGIFTGSISINGGTVSAASENGAGIGSGRDGSFLGSVSISGGNVSGTSTNGSGIGRGLNSILYGKINISGGYITAESANGDAISQDSSKNTGGYITGGYFADSGYNASTVYGCRVAYGYTVYDNTYTSTSSAYPCIVAHDHESYDDDGFCTVCGEGYEPAELNSDGVYEISNAGQLFWFSALVNGGALQKGITAAVSDANGILTTSINLDARDYTPIGTSESLPFTGTFDGKNYTIGNLCVRGFYYGGLFGYVNGSAVIQNVRTTGVVSGTAYVGGIVGYMYSSDVTVKNCINGAVIITAAPNAGGVVGYNYRGTVTGCINNGDITCTTTAILGYAGGIIAHNVGGTVSGCYNTGSVSANKYAGGINGNNGGIITSCYNIGTVTGGIYCGGVAAQNSIGTNLTYCYSLENTADVAIGSDTGKSSNIEIKTAEEFESGEVAYLMNVGTTDGTQAWYQTLGYDSYPVLDNSRGTVYYITPCDGSAAYYSNSLLGSHVGYDSDGFCTDCGGYEPAERNAEGVYEIGNAGQLFWFAALVNGDTEQEGITAANTGADAVLTKNINLKSSEWVPIGTKSAPYTGTFDGGEFEISGLSITKEAEYVGLFGYVSAGTIENLTVSGEINVSGGSIWAGGIVGTIRNGVLSDLTSNVNVTGKTTTKGTFGGVAATVEGTDKTAGSTMENCANYGTVTASGVLDCMGGLVGYMNSATINNCANYGEVNTAGATAKQNAGVNTGGIVGYINNKTAYITNCVNIGKVSNASSTDDMPCYTGAIVGIIRADLGGITNTYYLDTSAAQGCEVNENGAELGITAKTADELARGEVTYLLQNGDSDSVWGQDLASDAYPTLCKTNVVKLTFIDGESDIERFANVGAVFTNYPTGAYLYYTDSTLTERIDTSTYTYTADTSVYMIGAELEIRGITVNDNAVSVEIANAIADKGVVIAAAYDADGVMIDMATAELAKGLSSVSMEIDTAKAATVKAFIWESVETMVPLCGAISN